MTLSNHNGEDSFTIGGNSFTKRSTSGTPIYERAGGAGSGGGSGGGTGGGGGSSWSTGWVNTDGTNLVGSGQTLNFTHNLGTTDLLFNAYWASDASGTDSIMINNVEIGSHGTNSLGLQIQSITTTDVTVRLGNIGFIRMNAGGTRSGNPAFDGGYIKIVASGGIGGSGSASSTGAVTGVPRTKWREQAHAGLNIINKFNDFTPNDEAYFGMPPKTVSGVFPNAWIFSEARGLNSESAVGIWLGRAGDDVTPYAGASNGGPGCAGVTVSNSCDYCRGGNIICQTDDQAELRTIWTRSDSNSGLGISVNLMGYITPTVASDVIFDQRAETSDWYTVSTGKPNSFVMVMIEPGTDSTARNVSIKRKDEDGIIRVPAGRYARYGSNMVCIATGSAKYSHSEYRGGYLFCMTDSNGDLEIGTSVAGHVKATLIGHATAEVSDVSLHSSTLVNYNGNARNVITPNWGTNISTGLTGHHLVLVKSNGSAASNIFFRTPGSVATGYGGSSNYGWGASGAGDQGSYQVIMTDSNGMIEGFSYDNSHTWNVTMIGSMPINLA